MYFGIRSNFTNMNWEELEQLKEFFLNSFKEIQTTEWSYILKFNIKDIRKLKIKSLHDEKIKSDLEKFQKIINNKDKIIIYGEEKPKFGSSSSRTSGSSGSSGTSGPSSTTGPSNPLKNRYIGRPSKKIDFYKSKLIYRRK
jgi:hypothetical protein